MKYLYKTIVFLLSISLFAYLTLDSDTSIRSRAASTSLVINEVLYDPEGADTGYEWIELKNISENPIDLVGWSIQTAGTTFSTKVTLPTYVIEPHTLILIGEPQVAVAQMRLPSLAFQNGGAETDGIRIVDPFGTIIDTLLYDSPNTNHLPDDSSLPSDTFAPDVSSGNSLVRVGTEDHDSSSLDFVDSNILTPGAENLISPKAIIIAPSTSYYSQTVILDATDSADQNGSIQSYLWSLVYDDNQIASFSEARPFYTFAKLGTYTIKLTITDNDGLTDSAQTTILVIEDPENPIIELISDIKQLSSGTSVAIEGIITAPPGTLYAYDGYIQDSSGGIRLKSTEEKPLAFSSRYRVSGIIGTVYGERRLAITEATLLSSSEPISPLHIEFQDIPHRIGTLIGIELHIDRKQSKTLYGYKDDADRTIPIYLAELSGINSSQFGADQTISVIGVISQYGTNEDGSPKIRIMPRFAEDISIIITKQLVSTGSSLRNPLWALLLGAIVFSTYRSFRKFNTSRQ